MEQEGGIVHSDLPCAHSGPESPPPEAPESFFTFLKIDWCTTSIDASCASSPCIICGTILSLFQGNKFKYEIPRHSLI